MTTIGFVSGETVSAFFMRCLNGWVAAHPEYAPNLIHVVSGPTLDVARNHLVEAFLRQDSDRLLMMDTDMVFRLDDLERLLAHDLDVVSGLYMAGDGRLMAAPEWVEGLRAKWPPTPEYEWPGLCEVVATGMGCIAIKREVFEKIGSEWFNYLPTAGEDVSFCKRVADAGYTIWLDPTVKIGHVKPQVFMP